MTVSWTVEFECEFCNAKIVYDTETPTIYKDRQAIIENNKAKLWLLTHANDNLNVSHPENVAPYIDLFKSGWQLMLQTEKYTICTVCQGRIYIG